MRFCKTLGPSKTLNIPTFVFGCQIAKMPDPLDMSPDEIIRNKKKSSGASSNLRGRGSAPGPGPARRFGNRELLRTTPYSVAPGTAEVVFLRQTDALAAIKRYNNVRLDGKPLKIDLVGANFLTPAVVQPTTNGIMGKPKGFFRSVGDMGAAKGRVLVSNSKLGLRGGQGGERSEKISVEDLDADLEKYRIEAMQLN